MTKSLSLDDFKLNQVVLELRYDNAYLLWDKSGVIWSSVSQEWPTLKPQIIEPNNTTFIINNKYQVAVNLIKLSIIDLKPSSDIDNFSEVTNKIYDIVVKILNIEKFTRIGFRLIYIHDFINRELASNALVNANIISLPKGKHFNIEGKIFLPKYGFNWEGESVSVKILVEARDRKIDMDINPNFDDINPVHLSKHELVYDIDYSTLGVVSRGQLDIREWINQSYHIIRRDSKKILGGI